MNYFTPELIFMGRSNDDDVLDEQDRLWDEAGDRYTAYLDRIRAHLPSGLRSLIEGYYLHDAMVHGMGQQGAMFVIVLQLDTPPRSLLTLEYELLGDPLLIRDALPAEICTVGTRIDWMYDEIEFLPGEPPTWQQSILLTNGWEVRLHFRDLRLREVRALLPILQSQTAALQPTGG